MFCIKCGRQIPDDAVFCPACGATQGDQMPQAIAPNQPAAWKKPVSPEEDALAGSILTWGILGLAFSATVILGIIFSAIGLSKARRFRETYGPLHHRAKVGRILSLVGLIVSLVMILFWTVYGIIIAHAVNLIKEAEERGHSYYSGSYGWRT